ncbi:neuromast-expressed gpi-anchored lymphocyte antigen 6 [Carassius gibelio]|uniref:neuromast-expressed gpi-anchored lymphocyte antigen 6 n=1 Tax=Carassius gibelio TaxID=101364 RepID=UPI0022799DF5|nr:neuromast-expressed gpi-anchored lymphocyte antigen 6 [Carassius gibelio]
MAQPLLFILISTLFYKVNSLTCYQCIPETSVKCTETKVECPVGQCGTMKTTSYMGNNTLADMIMKNCSQTNQCVTASANFGITKIVINNQCCNTNLCNTQTEPESPKMIPNGMHCHTCNGEDCASALPCVDAQDHCIKATVFSDGQKMTMKGCATRSFCKGDLSTKIGQSSISADQSCCEGHLCNSAPAVSPRPSRFFQLGILMYILLTAF